MPLRTPARLRAPRPSLCARSRRFASVATSPSADVCDSDIARLASQPRHSLTLADLVRHGRPPLSQQALYNSANFSLSILPARLAYRIHALRNLPFIVVTNPHVAQIHNNYMHSLSTLLPWSEKTVATPEDEDTFTDIMAGLVQTHSNTIPVLARGFLESRKYITPASVTKFLDEHLRYRIGTRLIAEQHIALHNESIQPNPASSSSSSSSSYIGIIDTALRPVDVIRACEGFVSDLCEFSYGVRPTVVIDGYPDTTIAHVPVHLEYIVTELLKNAFRATIENGKEREPIQVTIAPTPTDPSQDLDARESMGIEPLAQASEGVTIRIRDQGGGIAPENKERLWTYGFTTFNEREASNAASSGSVSDALHVISGASAGAGSIAGLGYGLPLGRAYAEYFGGGISVQSLHGYGTDVYLKLKGVGRA